MTVVAGAGTIRIGQREANHAGARYEGDISLITGKREGQGTYSYPNPYFAYEGDWVAGQKHGQGRLTFEDEISGEISGGTYYEGSFVDGEMSGEGKRCWPDGRQYVGQFVLGAKHGRGCFEKPGKFTGYRYTGLWRRNQYHGEGELAFPGGDHYSGEFAAHKYHGRGSLKEALSGRTYVGSFEAGLFEGAGELREEASGFFYAGNFRNNLMDGAGKGLDASGVAYDGEWDENSPQYEAVAWDLGPTEGEEVGASYVPASEVLREEALNQLNAVAVADPKKDKDKGKKPPDKKGKDQPVEEVVYLGPDLEVFIGEVFPAVALRIVTAAESTYGKVAVTCESGRCFRASMFKQRRVPLQDDPNEFEVLERTVNFGDRRPTYTDPLDAEAEAAAAAAAAANPKAGKGKDAAPSPAPPLPAEEDEEVEPPFPGVEARTGNIGTQGEAVLGGSDEWFVPVHLKEAIYWLRIEDCTEFAAGSIWKVFSPLDIPIRVKAKPTSQ